MEEKGGRLDESNGACVDLSMNPEENVVHGSIDFTGMEDFVLC
jgi:phenolic acid decarboxylase